MKIEQILLYTDDSLYGKNYIVFVDLARKIDFIEEKNKL